jgi:hypothetical protein
MKYLFTGTAGVPPARKWDERYAPPATSRDECYHPACPKRKCDQLAECSFRQDCSRCALIAGGTPAVPVSTARGATIKATQMNGR